MAKQDTDISVDEALEGAGSDPRVYELGFHIDPELPTEEVKNIYQDFRTRIEGAATLVAEGEPMMLQLAYTISRQETAGRRDFDSAYFSWIVYEATPEAHAQIIAAASAEKRVVRFIDLVTTKDAARHAVEMRELALKTPEKIEDPEEVAGAELDAALGNVVV